MTGSTLPFASYLQPGRAIRPHNAIISGPKCRWIMGSFRPHSAILGPKYKWIMGPLRPKSLLRRFPLAPSDQKSEPFESMAKIRRQKDGFPKAGDPLGGVPIIKIILYYGY